MYTLLCPLVFIFFQRTTCPLPPCHHHCSASLSTTGVLIWGGFVASLQEKVVTAQYEFKPQEAGELAFKKVRFAHYPMANSHEASCLACTLRSSYDGIVGCAC